MKKVDRVTFELWAQTNEHSSNVVCKSRIIGDDFVTEYQSAYDNACKGGKHQYRRIVLHGIGERP